MLPFEDLFYAALKVEQKVVFSRRCYFFHSSHRESFNTTSISQLNNIQTMRSIESQSPDYDVLVIGAGLSGCYACYRMQKLNMKVKVLEAGSSVGGTWYWS